MKSRDLVLGEVVRRGVAKAYDIAKSMPYSVSTVYYLLSRLGAEGFVENFGGLYRPTFRGVLRYVEVWGCDLHVVNVVRGMVGGGWRKALGEEEVCEALVFLSKFRPYSRDLAPALFEIVWGGGKLAELPGSVRRLLAAVAASVGGAIDEMHSGVLLGRLFIGHCSQCGLSVKPCQYIKL